MHENALQYYVSPESAAQLEWLSVDRQVHNEILSGVLHDSGSGRRISVHNGIPRFVEGSNYADSFGEQWNRYRRVQLDSVNGSTLSRDRFYEGTGWTPAELQNARVLEAGCGAGRFSEVMLQAGAEVFSFDYSSAVDAARLNNARFERWNVAQGDIYAIPFRPQWFDYVFCFGVLQHTPDPKRAFLNLVRYVRPGGRIAVDVYARETGLTKLRVKYWYRPLTKRLPPRMLLALCEFYLPLWIPVDSFLQRIPKIGRVLAALVPCWNKSYLPLDRKFQREWTILDTFDALSPQFDFPQTVPVVQGWFEEAGLGDIQVRPGGNGIVAKARKPDVRL